MIKNIEIIVGMTNDSSVIMRAGGFPIAFVGKGSYLVSSRMETGLDIFEGNVYNFHIGKYCALAHDLVFLIDLSHDYKSVSMGRIPLLNDKLKMNFRLKRKGQILIQNDVYIGRGAMIMGGVTIHNGAVVAADSVVTKDVEPYSIVGGNPAKHIKYRFPPETIQKLQEIQWWNWSDQDILEHANWFQQEPEQFADHFYQNSPFTFSEQELDFEKMPYQYLYFPDFEESEHSTWKKVLTAFCQTFAEQENVGLVLFLQKNGSEERLYSKIINYVSHFDAKCSLFVYIGNEQAEMAIFRYADCYITSRLEKLVYYSCLADHYHVKILSGVDVPIFDSNEVLGTMG